MYDMLRSVQEMYHNMQEVLVKHAPAELRRLTSIDVELLKELTSFLEVRVQ